MTKSSGQPAGKAPIKAATEKPTLLSGGNPRIAKGDDGAPVQAYVAATPGGWTRPSCAPSPPGAKP